MSGPYETTPAAGAPSAPADFKGPDPVERGAVVDGIAQSLDARLFMQLHAFTGCAEPGPVVRSVRESGLEAVVYADVNDPRGIAILLMTEDPALFVQAGRSLLSGPPFASLAPRPDLTMLGRTYAGGREKDLRDWLLVHPRRNVLKPGNVWAIWYPLRRTGAFNRLPRTEQVKMMGEHSWIGRAYGEAGLANDIRLECHGLDRDDNEFVIGLVGAELHVLSKLIKDMRLTRQTSEYMEKMGPFFVGRALYQSPFQG